MDSRYRFLTLGMPWSQSMLSRDVNTATQLTEASWKRDNSVYHYCSRVSITDYFVTFTTSNKHDIQDNTTLT